MSYNISKKYFYNIIVSKYFLPCGKLCGYLNIFGNQNLTQFQIQKSFQIM